MMDRELSDTLANVVGTGAVHAQISLALEIMAELPPLYLDLQVALLAAQQDAAEAFAKAEVRLLDVLGQ